MPVFGAHPRIQSVWMRQHTQFAQHEMHGTQTMYDTTILCARKGDTVVVIDDGQVT